MSKDQGHVEDTTERKYTGSYFTTNILASERSGAKITENIISLAGELACNYFSNSFGDNYNMEVAKCEHIFKDGNTSEINIEGFATRFNRCERVRDISIIGVVHDSMLIKHPEERNILPRKHNFSA